MAFLTAVDREQPLRGLATESGAVGRRPLPLIVSLHTELSLAETRFLEYRLEVIGSWPDSERKRNLMDGIVGRLTALRPL